MARSVRQKLCYKVEESFIQNWMLKQTRRRQYSHDVLCNFICSPLYFVIRKKWGAFLINGFFYLWSIPLLFFAGFGAIIWALCVGHAGWHLRKELMDEQAQMIATRMVEKMGPANFQPAVAYNQTAGGSVLAGNTEAQQQILAHTSAAFCSTIHGKLYVMF